MEAIGAIDRLEIEAGGFVFTGRACGPHDGRRVLLLHGFPQTSWAWRDELWALGQAGYRAVAPDLRGYCPGARPPAATDYATERLLGDVLSLANALDMETFDLVGHDWGGMLAWITAARHPGRVRTLGVVSTPHPLALQDALRGGDPAQAAHGAATDSFRAPEVPERLLLGADGSGKGLASLLAETGLDDDDARMYVAALSEPGALTAALNWYRAMDRGTLRDLPPIAVPTLYVWPSGDGAVGRRAAEATAACVRGPYTFEVLENVSHWVPEMAPFELSDLLLKHLAAY
ncbi:MAG TPA: alpha/beta hydrolase [Acidimicrobiales bacterium]|nr:alpha/beta hydrolase [Acidimicrobiales bacterium]